jgi:hypothetical protein
LAGVQTEFDEALPFELPIAGTSWQTSSPRPPFNRDVKIIRMIFRVARLDGYLFQDPAEGVQIIKSRSNGEKPRRPLTIAEIW